MQDIGRHECCGTSAANRTADAEGREYGQLSLTFNI
nr:MAG TPA: hypothetical protein [Caudoviricetes sp.]